MTLLSALFLIAATPVEPAELAKAQSALEAYLKNIETLQVMYTDKFTPPPGPMEIAKDPLAGPPETGSVYDSKLVNDNELLYAYPSMRLKVLERRKYRDGRLTERDRDTRIHEGKLIQVSHSDRDFHEKTKLDGDPFPSLPIDPLGLRILSPEHRSLSDFLKFPDITTSEGEDNIDGERVIVLKIGPNIPLSVRPKFWGDTAFVKVWLAPKQSHLPLRIELHPKYKTEPDRVWGRTIGSLKAVRDVARNKEVPFPHRLEIQWPTGGRSTYVVTSAVINPQVTDEDFVMKPPFGYFTTIDGEIAKSRLAELTGKPAPVLSLQWREGDKKTLAELRGKVVVLYFWASWCKPCVERIPKLMEMRERLSKEGVEWIAIQDCSNEESDEYENELARLQTKHWGGSRMTLRAAFDVPTDESGPRGATTTQYDIRFWPTAVILDREGKVAGAIEDEVSEEAIRKFLD